MLWLLPPWQMNVDAQLTKASQDKGMLDKLREFDPKQG